MKVRMVFESSGARMEVEAEDASEDKMLAAAFGECELRGQVTFNRSYGGGGYSMPTDRHATLHIKLVA